MATSAAASVAANVRAELARAGVRRAEAAAAAGLSLPALHRRLRGEIALNVDELRLLAQLLGVTTARLLGEDAA